MRMVEGLCKGGALVKVQGEGRATRLKIGRITPHESSKAVTKPVQPNPHPMAMVTYKEVVETPAPEADPLYEPGFDTKLFLLFYEVIDEGNSDCLTPDQIQFYEQNKWRIGL